MIVRRGRLGRRASEAGGRRRGSGVTVWPGAPSGADLAAAGAVRISLGSAIAQVAYAVAARAATELLTSGTYDSAAGGIAYDR